MTKIESLKGIYTALISNCDDELEKATGLLECHIMTKKECYIKFIQELEECEAELT